MTTIQLIQLQNLFKKGYQDQLTLYSDNNNKFYYPSLVINNLFPTVKLQLETKKQQDELRPHEYCWLWMAKKALHQDCTQIVEEMKSKQCEKYISLFKKWQQSRRQSLGKSLTSKRIQCRQKFQQLSLRASNYNYFNQKQVPVYLISTQWLSQLYQAQSTSENLLFGIDNRPLATLLPHYISTQPQYIHLNYQVNLKAKQNTDYKIISPDTWQFLYKVVGGGIQIKRYTTSQEDPTVQIFYRKLLIYVLEGRYFHVKKLQLLVPRFSTFGEVVQRVKKLLISYRLVEFAVLKKEVDVIRVKQLDQKTLLKLVQDQEVEQLTSENFIKIQPQLDIQEAQIYGLQQTIILNLYEKQKTATSSSPFPESQNLFSSTQSLETIITRQKCLNCGETSQKLFECFCGTVHFCSVSCQKSHKQHTVQCKKLQKCQMMLNRLINDYKITNKQFNLSLEGVKKYGKVGLENLRNTCYLNSALQCILRVDKLVGYFATNDHLKDINVDNVLGTEGRLAAAFGQLVKSYFTTNKRALQPIQVLRIIAQNPQFRGYQHQDSQQFLNYFLDKLHQDLNRIKKKPYTQDIQSNGRADQIVSKQSWQNYLKRNRSFIQQLFTGQYRSQIKCPDCQRISITFDPFMSVTLPFPKEQKKQHIKGYILTLSGQFQKVQLDVKENLQTEDFYRKYFDQNVIGMLVKNKLVKKQWKDKIRVSKNNSDEGILLFYYRPQGWKMEITLQFCDQKGQLTAFTRKIFSTKIPQDIEELKSIILVHNRVPIEKGLKQNFQSNEAFVKFCLQKEILKFYKPSQESIEFPLSQQQQNSLTLRLYLNPLVDFPQKVKFNFSSKSYELKRAYQAEQKTQEDPRLGISLKKLIQNFKHPQQLTEDNMWYCNRCKQHKMADKQMQIYKLPQYLIIHLKRFNHKNTRYRNLIGVEKIEKSVRLNEFEQIDGLKYELLGVVNHFGSMSFGHYTAYVKKDQWVTYDDETVKKCKLNGDNAYLLVYKRIEEEPKQ